MMLLLIIMLLIVLLLIVLLLIMMLLIVITMFKHEDYKLTNQEFDYFDHGDDLPLVHQVKVFVTLSVLK